MIRTFVLGIDLSYTNCSPFIYANDLDVLN